MGEIFANSVAKKCLMSKIYKQLIELINNNNKKQPYPKMGRRPKLRFLQRRNTDVQEHIKR